MQAYMFPMLRDDFQLVETYTVRPPSRKSSQLHGHAPGLAWSFRSKSACLCSMLIVKMS
jgi:surfactin synthase thioesterase subunit